MTVPYLTKTHFSGSRIHGDDNEINLHLREYVPFSSPNVVKKRKLCSKDCLALTNACGSMTSVEKEEMKVYKHTPLLLWLIDKLNLHTGIIRAKTMTNL